MTPAPASPVLRPRRRILRRVLLAFAAAVVLFALAAAIVYVASERRLQRDYAIAPRVSAPDPSLVEEGRRLARSRGCADCHGDDFGGRVVADAMPFARLVGPGLARRDAAMPARDVHRRMYKALHHGVDAASRPLLMMPSAEYSNLSKREIEALSAFFASLPPTAKPLPDSRLGPLGRTLLVAGKLEGFLSAEVIDHARDAVDAPPPLGTLAYGRHAAQLCTGCHQADFAGGPTSHGGPGRPPAANLTPDASGLAAWGERDFIAAMRTGRRPDGSAIDGRAMPWRAVGSASDEELRSIWLFLRSLPPIARDARAGTPGAGG